LPDEILRAQIQRTVAMFMTIDRQGRLIEAIAEEGSGLSSIDQASLTAVLSAAPFGNLPDDYLGETLRIRIPLKIAAA
jgi:outer membrane biosynthesis protein TonB